MKQFPGEDPSVYTILKSSFVCNATLCVIMVDSGLADVFIPESTRRISKYKKIVKGMLEEKGLTATLL